MANGKFSSGDLSRASLLKQAQLYRKQGYKKAVTLKRKWVDYENHLFAFLIDLNLCLLPVYLWAIEFVLILTGLIPPRFFDLLFYLMYALLFVCSCVLLPMAIASSRGQTIGMRIVGLKLVNLNKQEASVTRLVLRELFGFGIPLMLFGYFFSVGGLLVWWAVSAIVVLLSPNQQTIFDWVFSLIPVYVPEYTIRFGKKPEEEGENDINAIHQQAEQSLENQEPEEKKEASESSSRVSPIDLHIRSSFSDDAQTDVEEIFRMAKDRNMEVISITDHNCARANAQAVRFASMYNIQYIPGVEADVQFEGQRVRILAYYIDWTNPVFDEIEKASLRREKDASLKRVKAFEDYMKIRIDVDSILTRSRFQIITGTDLTNMVFNNPKTRELPVIKEYLETFKTEKEARDAFIQDTFGKGGPCEVQRTYPDAQAFIEAVHNAGGLAILSSWHADELSDSVLEGLLSVGLDGLEVFTPHQNPKTAAFLLTLASQEKLFVTAGSDYHGPQRPGNELGVTGCPPKGLETVRVFTRALETDQEA